MCWESEKGSELLIPEMPLRFPRRCAASSGGCAESGAVRARGGVSHCQSRAGDGGRKKSNSNEVESAEQGCTEWAVWLKSERQSEPNNNRGIICRLDGVNSDCLQLSGCIESGSRVFFRCRHWNPLL